MSSQPQPPPPATAGPSEPPSGVPSLSEAGSPEELALRYINLGGQRCPACRYDINGLSRLICPECGAQLRLEVGSPQLNLGAWLFALVPLSMALGFDVVVFTLVSTVALIVDPPAPAQLNWVFFLLGVFAVLATTSILPIIMLVKRRRAWARLRPERQRLLAAAIAVGIVVIHAAGGGLLMYQGR